MAVSTFRLFNICGVYEGDDQVHMNHNFASGGSCTPTPVSNANVFLLRVSVNHAIYLMKRD